MSEVTFEKSLGTTSLPLWLRFSCGMLYKKRHEENCCVEIISAAIDELNRGSTETVESIVLKRMK